MCFLLQYKTREHTSAGSKQTFYGPIGIALLWQQEVIVGKEFFDSVYGHAGFYLRRFRKPGWNAIWIHLGWSHSAFPALAGSSSMHTDGSQSTSVHNGCAQHWSQTGVGRLYVTDPLGGTSCEPLPLLKEIKLKFSAFHRDGQLIQPIFLSKVPDVTHASSQHLLCSLFNYWLRATHFVLKNQAIRLCIALTSVPHPLISQSIHSVFNKSNKKHSFIS